MPKSAIISIGNEILLGRTLNTNLAYLAAELALLGLPVEFSLTVKDEEDAILNALRQCWEQVDIVITTGGLGPTDDDITKSTIARFFGKEQIFDETVWEHVQKLFSARNMPTPGINRNQALVPEGFKALRNDRGTAPGLFFEEGEKSFFAFAGVPLEMKFVFETRVRSILSEKYPEAKAVKQTTLHTFGISESALAERLTDFVVPEGVSFAWLPQTGRVDLRFYGSDADKITGTVKSCLPLIQDHYWGRDEDTPASVLSDILRREKLVLSAAESCTGGLLQKMLTDLPGSSDVFTGGVVTYSNQLKNKVLDISEDMLLEFGAVSEECALAMVRGIKCLTESQVAISITGIAGPDGGTPQKPVGTVCFGFSDSSHTWSKTLIFSGDRESIRYKSVEYALLHMIKHLKG
jgi:nicotinamide-nucleotide amidase